MLMAFLLTGSWAFAQNGTVTGTIQTTEGTPAVQVRVVLKETTYATVTDNNGSFTMTEVAPGDYILQVLVPHGTALEKTIHVDAGSSVKLPGLVANITKNTELDEFVVIAEKNRYAAADPSASLRLNAPLLEIPQNIQVISKDALADQQVISMSDGVLRNVSGTYRSEHWGDLYTNVNARGSQVQAFRNGFNVVNSYWGPLTEDMSTVERVEFVKGPAGFMLANGDPSGLYNVVTKKPTGNERGEVSFTLGSFDLYRAAVDLDGKLSQDGKWLYRLNVSAQNKKSHRVNEFNDRYSIAPVISYQLDKNTKLTLEYNYQRANMSNVGSYYIFSPTGYETLPREVSWLPQGLPSTKINDHSLFAYLEHRINPSWKVNVQLARFHYMQQGSSMWASVVNPDGKFIRNVSIWDAKSIMSMGQAYLTGDVKTGPIRHRVLAGLDMSNKSYWADWGQGHDLDSIGAEFDPFNPNLGTPVNGFPEFDYSKPLEERAQLIGGLMDSRYAGIYVQDELGFFENRVRLTLAGRYTYIQQSAWGGAPVSDKHVTPRIGLSANVHKNMAVYALYDQAFIPQNGKLANGDRVQPITGNNQEIGIKNDWFGGKWNTVLAVYRILKNNELTADPNSPPTSGLSVELGQKVSQGVELDVRGTVFKGFNVIVNYAWTESKVLRVTEGVTSIKEGDVVPGFARHTANAWLSYRISEGVLRGLGASLGGTFLGDRETSWDLPPAGGAELPDYFRLDGGIFWENNKLKVTANVFNILNEYLYSGSYYTWLNAYYVQTEPGRNVRLSVAYNF